MLWRTHLSVHEGHGSGVLCDDLHVLHGVDDGVGDGGDQTSNGMD